MQVTELDTTAVTYINEIKTQYEQQIHKLKTELLEYQYKYLQIKERYDLLIYKRFVRISERLLGDEKQLLLFPVESSENATAPCEDEKQEISEIKSYSRRKSGRKPLDPKLPRVEKLLDIPETEKICCCGAKLTRIGEETSEKLHIIPPRIYVEKTIRPKYGCRSCEGTTDEQKPAVRIAPVEPAIIARSIVSPSLLSCILIQKYEDHLPFYRQEKQFQRIGVRISRQDMSNWQQQAYAKLTPLLDLLQRELKSGPVIQMDETQVQVMGEEGRQDTQKSWMWVARGGPTNRTVVLYTYRETRAAYHAKALLEGYRGYVQTDGYEAYDAALKGMAGIVHVGCFAHARRKFFEASKAVKKPQSAEEGMKYIRKLYFLEDKLRAEGKDEQSFVAERKSLAGPILAQFKAWLLKRSQEVPPNMLLGKAIYYSLSQWQKMTAYLQSPHLTPDNNGCENAIRPFVLGRKNWLFNKSPEGAESSCGMYSLIETAKQNNLIPLNYLTALFEKAPFASSQEDWEKLLPWNIFK